MGLQHRRTYSKTNPRHKPDYRRSEQFRETLAKSGGEINDKDNYITYKNNLEYITFCDISNTLSNY